MTSPIYDFITKYAFSDTARFHMPGAKGTVVLGPEPMDITEIKGADELYEPDGIIAQSEEMAASLFGTAITCYSTEGSSHCIRSMVYLARQIYGADTEEPIILAARNVHKSFLYACAVAGVDADFVYPSNNEINSVAAGIITPKDLRNALCSMDKKPMAVYITTPDYLGGMADIYGIKKVCAEYDLPLLVDNAHGAYLHFLKNKLHPMDLGADMCCDSAHKTLPALTGSAYLHIKNSITDKQTVKMAMEITGTTSPSYLILASLDQLNCLMEGGMEDQYNILACWLEEWKKDLIEKGIPLLGSEPLKIVVDAARLGVTGKQLGDILRANGAEPEFCDNDYLVAMVTPNNTAEDFSRLKNALLQVKKLKLKEIDRKSSVSLKLEKKLSIRAAVMSRQELIDVEEAAGRICGIPMGTCPPAVPIAISGELITKEIIPLFKSYNINKISVVK